VVKDMRSSKKVRSVVIGNEALVIVYECEIFIYMCDTFRVILHFNTCVNTRGLCTLATSVPFILCCPGQSVGEVRVQASFYDKAKHFINAHETALAAMTLSASGSLLATASEYGTVLKVFHRSDGRLLHRLRRGMQRRVISCLAFHSDEQFLAVASVSPTVHVFKFDSTPELQKRSDVPPMSGNTVPLVLGPTPPPPPSGQMVLGPVPSTTAEFASSPSTSAETAGVLVRGKFRLPEVDVDSNGQPAIDARAKQSQISGPQLAFHPKEPKLFVLHYSGILYEYDCTGMPDCSLVAASTWFAVRPGFKIQDVGGESQEENVGEWQLL